MRDPFRGKIVYTFRGWIERPTRRGYAWQRGYSATGLNGSVLYPWMTKRECADDARQLGKRASFYINSLEPVSRQGQ